MPHKDPKAKKRYMQQRYQQKAEEIKAYQKTYRKENAEAIKVKRRPYQRRMYLIGRIVPKIALLLEAGGKCERCGFDQLAALQFHHRDSSTKRFSVAQALTQSSRKQYSMKEIRMEAAKCEVVCANCHAIEHCTWTPEEIAEMSEHAMKQLVQAHVLRITKEQ